MDISFKWKNEHVPVYLTVLKTKASNAYFNFILNKINCIY